MWKHHQGDITNIAEPPDNLFDHRACIYISRELLAGLLNLPPEVHIVHVEYNPMMDVMGMYVVARGLPQTVEGGVAPSCNIRVANVGGRALYRIDLPGDYDPIIIGDDGDQESTLDSGPYYYDIGDTNDNSE